MQISWKKTIEWEIEVMYKVYVITQEMLKKSSHNQLDQDMRQDLCFFFFSCARTLFQFK